MMLDTLEHLSVYGTILKINLLQIKAFRYYYIFKLLASAQV